MAWQRTGLAVAAFSTLLVRVADRDLVLTVPGLLGLVLALGLVVVGERRYSNIVERVQTERTPLADRPRVDPRARGFRALGGVAGLRGDRRDLNDTRPNGPGALQ